MKTTLFSMILVLCASQVAYAIVTDEHALEAGMMPIEEYVMSEMRAVLTPGLNIEGVQEAIHNHRLVIAVNKAKLGPGAQTLTMYENGVEILQEKISTGREMQEIAKSGKTYFSATPKGFFRPKTIYKDYFSKTWKAPMANAVFFIGGIALHATGKSYYHELGTRASGGCIRLRLEHSAFVRKKIMESGRGSQSGQFGLLRVGEGRVKVTKSSVKVRDISRQTGRLLKTAIDSWDTVIIVYEE